MTAVFFNFELEKVVRRICIVLIVMGPHIVGSLLALADSVVMARWTKYLEENLSELQVTGRRNGIENKCQ